MYCGHASCRLVRWFVRSARSDFSKRTCQISAICVKFNLLSTFVGRRAFSVAGARVWNALPADVTSAPSLFTFRKRLKLHLFPLSYPGLVL